MRISLSALLDSIFCGFICFIVCFLILNYFFLREYAIIISVVFSLLIMTIALKRLWAKNQLVKLKKSQEKLKNECLFNLKMTAQNKILDLFSSAIEKLGRTPKKQNGGIIIQQKSVALFFKFSFDGVCKSDVVKFFNACPKNYTTYIFADEFSSELLAFIDRFNKKIIAVDGVKTFKFLSKTDCLPQSSIEMNKEKLSFIKAKTNLLQRKNAKRYFTFGLIFLFMSFFVPLKLYYVICACLFLTFSLFCRLYGITK